MCIINVIAALPVFSAEYVDESIIEHEATVKIMQLNEKISNILPFIKVKGIFFCVTYKQNKNIIKKSIHLYSDLIDSVSELTKQIKNFRINIRLSQ